MFLNKGFVDNFIRDSHKLPAVNSLVDLFASIITIAPALTFTLSGTSAFPRVLAFSSTKPVLRFIDIAINHKLTRLLVSFPVVAIKTFLVGEQLTKMIGKGWA